MIVLDKHVLLCARGAPRRMAQDVQTRLKDEDSRPFQ